HFKDLETLTIRAHYIAYAISCVLLAICFAYFGRKVKGFAEGSIRLLMSSELDVTLPSTHATQPHTGKNYHRY
ncbi:8936_t:CDS:1, partial [Funneliformis caledonium]